MRIRGEWLLCDDGVVRPAVTARLDGLNSVPAERFLIDTGADETVLSAAVLSKLGTPTAPPPSGMSIVGVGGQEQCVEVESVIVFEAEDGSPARFRGKYAAFVGTGLVEMSILGRNILDHVDLIVSRRRNEVFLLVGKETYRIEKG